MSNKCTNCGLVNFPGVPACGRCGAELSGEVERAQELPSTLRMKILRRAGVVVLVSLALLFGFYLSLVGSAKSLSYDEKQVVRRAVSVLQERGFANEAMLLRTVTVFRGTDNWLNASVPKENAYAATNFPFEIVTLYPDFFAYPVDDVERAAILLHEAKHLAGKDEHDAYKFVWDNRVQLGWTRDKYRNSAIWQNVRRQTADNVPEMFVCDANELGDCSEPRVSAANLF